MWFDRDVEVHTDLADWVVRAALEEALEALVPTSTSDDSDEEGDEE